MDKTIRRILVVEDDYLQAQDISFFVRGTGGEVLGPVGTLEKGFDLAPLADSAVLDVDLHGQLVFPLADMLMGRGVPIVFYSGAVSSVSFPARFWHLPVVRKPVRSFSDAAVVTLSSYMGGEDEDIYVILPKLRLAARLIYNDTALADRLVERLLQDAIAHLRAGHELGGSDARTNWLMTRMRQILYRHGPELMN